MAKIESITKKLTAHLRSVYGDVRFFARKEEGVISASGTRVAFLEATTENATLRWNLVGLDGTGIVKDDVVAFFNRSFTVQWSS